MVIDPTPDRTGLMEHHCESCNQTEVFIMDGIVNLTDERLEFYTTGGLKFQHGETYAEYITVVDERPAGSATIHYEVVSDTQLKVTWLDEKGNEHSELVDASTDSSKPSTKVVISTGGQIFVSRFGWVVAG